MKYEKWSLGYWALKQYVRFIDWIIVNKTIVIGKDKIPRDKPILFAPNHQNALSDPMAVLLNTKYQPVWLARADIFKNKTVILILRFMKIIPVYRLRDGKDKLVKNDETFANSIKVLENNSALALFPETTHSGKRQLLSHKKAVPRIVFMAEEKTGHNLDIQIIPTGIYYSSYWKFNRNLIVIFGDPIPVNNFLDEYKENQNSATLSLRNKISESVKTLVLHFETQTNYRNFEKIRDFYGLHFLKRQNKKMSIVNRFKSDKILAKKLDGLENEKPEEIDNLINELKDYDALIKKLKIRSWLVENSKNNVLQIAINKLILLIGLPIFAFGFLLNAIPFFVSDIIIRRKIKDRSFWSSFALAFGIILFPIIYLLQLLALSMLIQGVWIKIALLVSMPFAGKIAFKWYILLRKTVGRNRYFILKYFRKPEYQHLLKTKEKLFQTLDRLISSEL